MGNSFRAFLSVFFLVGLLNPSGFAQLTIAGHEIRMLGDPVDVGGVGCFLTGDEKGDSFIEYDFLSGSFRVDNSFNISTQSLQAANFVAVSTDAAILVGLYNHASSHSSLTIVDLRKKSNVQVTLPGRRSAGLVLSGDKAFVALRADGLRRTFDVKTNAFVMTTGTLPNSSLLQVDLGTQRTSWVSVFASDPRGEISRLKSPFHASSCIYFDYEAASSFSTGLISFSRSGHYSFDHASGAIQRESFPAVDLTYDGRYIDFDPIAKPPCVVAVRQRGSQSWDGYHRSMLEGANPQAEVLVPCPMGFGTISNFVGVSPNGKYVLLSDETERPRLFNVPRVIQELRVINVDTKKSTSIWRSESTLSPPLRFIGWRTSGRPAATHSLAQTLKPLSASTPISPAANRDDTIPSHSISSALIQQISAGQRGIKAYRAKVQVMMIDPNGGFASMEDNLSFLRPDKMRIDRLILSAHNADAKGQRISICIDGRIALTQINSNSSQLPHFVDLQQVANHTGYTVRDFLASKNNLLDPLACFTTDTLQLEQETSDSWIIKAEYKPTVSFWANPRLTIDKASGTLRRIEVDDPRTGGRMAILDVTEFEAIERIDPEALVCGPSARDSSVDDTKMYIEQIHRRAQK